MGHISAETFFNLQDAELKLLENMRFCINARVKCDREYSSSLQAISGYAQKLDFLKETKNSVAAGWSIIAQETDTLGKLIKKRSDNLALEVLEQMDDLIGERKALRKSYHEQHSKIVGEYEKLQNSVVRTKSDYEKCHSNYNLAKNKYEELYLKVPNSGGNYSLTTINRRSKKFAEVKQRYLKTGRKLHLLHNEYVLLIAETNHYLRDMSNRLIPSLNKFQTTVLRETAEKWKCILEKFVDIIDFTGEKFQAIHWRMRHYVDSILDKDDYKDLEKDPWIGSLRKQAIAEAKFEGKLMKDYTGNLKENQLTIDFFTFDTLKTAEYDLQSRLIQCQQELRSKEKQVKQMENEMVALNTLCEGTTETVKRNANALVGIEARRRAINILRREVTELECRHERLHTVWEKVEAVLSGVTENSIPMGLTLEAGTGSDTASRTTQSPSNTPTTLRRSETPSATYSAASFGRFLVNKLRSPFAQAKEVMVTDSTKLPDAKKIDDEDWFHGILPREDVSRLLVNEGDFLVRETVKSGEKRIVVSVYWSGSPKHFLVQETEDGYFKFEGPIFRNIADLIGYHKKHKTPLTVKSGCVLVYAISKERWELNNADIVLQEKIGRGNFGDVHQGLLKKGAAHGGQSPATDLQVAVKTCKMNLPDEQKRKFLQEGRILKLYDHPNIVKFIGLCVQKEPIMIVMELVPGGSLLNFLRNNRSTDKIFTTDLMRMTIDAASGMEYLENNNCIHRDLAARNCLIGLNNVVKISDFGMSREAEQEYTVSEGLKQIPIKWTAPEALNYGRYTSLCDVWSYGILMWEVFSFGSVPYSGMGNAKARELIDNGYRLPSPPNTPVLVYHLMKRCWEYEPEKRPRFSQIHRILQDISNQFTIKR